VQELFVSRKNVRDLASVLVKGFRSDLHWRLVVIFRVTDPAQGMPGSQAIFFNLQICHRQLYGCDLVVVIVDGEVPRQPSRSRFAAQELRAKRMKRGNPGLRR